MIPAHSHRSLLWLDLSPPTTSHAVLIQTWSPFASAVWRYNHRQWQKTTPMLRPSGGSRQVFPLLLTPSPSMQPDRVSKFIGEASHPREASVLTTPPPRRRPRAPSESASLELPRRSKTVAAHHRVRATNPITQAQNVLMHKFGITSDECPPDADAVVECAQVFHEPLSEHRRSAIRALFKNDIPAPPEAPKEEL